jgi:hypothetical protein
MWETRTSGEKPTFANSFRLYIVATFCPTVIMFLSLLVWDADSCFLSHSLLQDALSVVEHLCSYVTCYPESVFAYLQSGLQPQLIALGSCSRRCYHFQLQSQSDLVPME